MENSNNKALKTVYLGSAPESINCLNKSGRFDITQMDTVIEAVNYLQVHPEIEVIIAETHLPGNDGIQARDFLRERKVIAGIPFILLSFQEEHEMFNRAFHENIDDFYQTPLNAERIYQRVLFLKNREFEKVEINSSPAIAEYKTPFVKRLFDITLAGGALILLSPLLLIIIIAIKLESPGPFYYVSKRVGANFRTFGFLKFRSMRVGADKLQKELSHLNQYAKKKVEDSCPDCAKLPPGQYCSPITYIHGEEICDNLKNRRKKEKAAFLKLENDPRITKVGKFIRNTSIDELPQLINIIKGDMSIVGNRPLPYDEAVELTITEKRAKRFHAAAGLTGLWQVELRGQGGVMSEETRFELDAKYAENNSFWGDIKLIFRTFKIFIQPGNV
ncbi:MAG: sugar transferase [Bacteroidales bacterium]|nr:sugar transferase [Bacteroidales bacterium]